MTDPKPYLQYLNTEMTIMGLLSVFSVALASLITDRIMTAESGFLMDVWFYGHFLVIAAGTAAILAASLFYWERSFLAGQYGFIALAQCLGTADEQTVEQLLREGEQWTMWTRYRFGFIALILSFLYYICAIAEAFYPNFFKHLELLFLLLLAIGALIWGLVVFSAFGKFPDAERPFICLWKWIWHRKKILQAQFTVSDAPIEEGQFALIARHGNGHLFDVVYASSEIASRHKAKLIRALNNLSKAVANGIEIRPGKRRIRLSL